MNLKRIVSILMVGLILHLSTPQAKAPGPVVVAFVIGVTIITVGIGIIIWVKLKQPAPGGIYYWALEKSTDHVNWTPVATNTLRMTDEKAWDAFTVDRDKDQIAFWRMRCLGATIWTNYVDGTFIAVGNDQVHPILQQ